MSGMTCTRCFGPALDLDTTGYPAAVIIDLCQNWLCPSCLDDVEREQAEEGSRQLAAAIAATGKVFA